MKILMISLDQNILDRQSRVAERMRHYGLKDEIFIIIPAPKKVSLDLSPLVHVFAVGGNKLSHFFQIKILGQKIIKENGINLITSQDPFFTGLLGYLLKQKSRIMLEIQVHGDFFGSDYYSGWRQILGLWVVRRADRVRVAGERIKESLIKLDVREDKIIVQPVQVDKEKIKNYQPGFNLHEKYPNFEKIFLVLGRLEPVKNISWLIDVFGEAAKQKPNYLLLIVGDGLEKNKLIKKTRKKHLERNIKFEGWTIDPISYLKTADCLLFPSLSEGYGLAAMEAVVVGMPVIMSEVGVAGYELKQGPKVTIVPVGDKEKFMAAILEI